MKPTWLACKTCLWLERNPEAKKNGLGELFCHWDGNDYTVDSPDYWCNHWVCAACRESWAASDHGYLTCREWFDGCGVGE